MSAKVKRREAVQEKSTEDNKVKKERSSVSTGVTLREVLRHEENQPVLRLFLVTSIALAVLPLLAFLIVQSLIRRYYGVDGALVAAASSIVTVLCLVGAYAIHAYYEEKRDYFATHPDDKRPVWGVKDDPVLLSNEKQKQS